MAKKPTDPVTPRSFREHILASIENTLLRTRDTAAALLEGGMVAGAIAVTAAGGLAGCSPPGDGVGVVASEVIGQGQTDWAQQQGQRNTSMVSYYGENWNACTQPGPRGSCSLITYYFKVAVRPAQGANLDTKRVGLVYRQAGTSQLTTVTGHYFTTWADGREEWHVPVTVNYFSSLVFSFNAWYQDGLGNTYYDDNNGELHAHAHNNYTAIAHDYGGTTVAVTAQGVQGRVSVRLADLDYDKQVSMMWTTDHWATVNTMTMGSGDNQWRWAEDIGEDFERWEVNVNLPGDFQQFEYAVVYRHGVVNGAATYQYWDNNGGYNYVVYRQ